MNIIVCLDERNGMSFNKRRQSRDRAVITMVSKIIDGRCIRMHPKSQQLFSGLDMKIHACVEYLETAGENDWCFIETENILPYMGFVQKIVIFRWHRAYPFDLRFPAERLITDFSRVSIADIQGFSHPIITMEVYSR